MAEKTFNNVKLNVDYTKATILAPLNPSTDKNLSTIIGKIARWYDELGKGGTYTFTTGDTLGTFNVSLDGGTPTPVTVNLNGVVTTVDGKISPSLLPSYVDDVIEGYYDPTTNKFYEDASKTTAIEGETGKIYIDITGNNNVSYRFISEESGYYSIKSELPPVFSTSSDGLVPKPASTDTAKFLRGDGSWQTITDTKNTAGSVNSTAKLYLIGAGSQGSNPQTYSNSAIYMQNGTLTVTTLSATNITGIDDKVSVMTGATASVDGAKGLVPQPKAGDDDAVLCGDGNWYDTFVFNCVADS